MIGILTSALGSKLAWWIDPAGAVRSRLPSFSASESPHLTARRPSRIAQILIACGVITSWTITVTDQFTLLAGRSAPSEMVNFVLYKVRPPCCPTRQSKTRAELEFALDASQCMTFSPLIKQIDSIKIYANGEGSFFTRLRNSGTER